MAGGWHAALTWLAVVNIGLAVLASVPGFTDALVAAICVLTLGAMSAGVLHALVDIDLTCLSFVGERHDDEILGIQGWI